MYKLKYKIWLEQNGKAFGQGPWELLTDIKRTGSLAQAAKAQNMSYSQAHRIMKQVSQSLGFSLLISKSGGIAGGETKLTPAARSFLETYDRFYQDCEAAVDDIYYHHFFKNQEVFEDNTLVNAFGLGRQGIVAFVGGGGKTTLMWGLAEELTRRNKKVLLTTTTHIFKPYQKQIHVCVSRNLAEIEAEICEHLDFGKIFVLGSAVEGEKLKGIPPSWLDRLANFTDYILVEADGSKQKPFKAPSDHEPVIPSIASTVVTVVGIDILGKPLTEKNCHRSKLVSELTGVSKNEKITIKAVTDVLLSPNGGFKAVPKNAQWVIAINKVDNLGLEQDADLIAKCVLAKSPFAQVVATSNLTKSVVVNRWQN